MVIRYSKETTNYVPSGNTLSVRSMCDDEGKTHNN
jgi:hypothetical protein